MWTMLCNNVAFWDGEEHAEDISFVCPAILLSILYDQIETMCWTAAIWILWVLEKFVAEYADESQWLQDFWHNFKKKAD